MNEKLFKIIVNDGIIDITDGYHTFSELYSHRCTLFSALLKSHKDISWKSKRHSDGSSFDDWFIAGMNLPSGMITYHLPIDQFWDKLSDINELEYAPEWDGHTSNDVVKRLLAWMG